LSLIREGVELRRHLVFIVCLSCVHGVEVGAAAATVETVPDHAVVLLYHHVDTTTPPSTSVAPEVFEEHLEYLDRHGFRVLSLPAVIDSLTSGTGLPDSVVVFTFDDGYESVYSEAFPRLRQRGWPFAVFVCPDAVDHRRGPVLTWDQMREMAAAGATIANHGNLHAHMQRKGAGESEAAWTARTREELEAAAEAIRDRIGQDPGLFAYPYGEYDAALRQIVADLGWTGFGQQSGALQRITDRTLLPRFPMAGVFASMETFGTKVGCLPLPVVSAEPADPNLPLETGRDFRPVLQLTLAEGDYQQAQLASYASGQGAAALTWIDVQRRILEIRSEQPLAPGRSRYNVTAPSSAGNRWYWYSHTWILGQVHED